MADDLTKVMIVKPGRGAVELSHEGRNLIGLMLASADDVNHDDVAAPQVVWNEVRAAFPCPPPWRDPVMA